MWTVIYITQDKETIEKLRKIFEEKEIIIRIREVNKDNSDSSVYELLVPDSEIGQAHEVLLSVQL